MNSVELRTRACRDHLVVALRAELDMCKAAAAGDRGAAELLEQRGGPGADSEFRVYLDDLAKSAPTTPDGRRAQDLLDERAREARERRDKRGSR